MSSKHEAVNIFVVAEQFRIADKMLNLFLQGELTYRDQRLAYDVSTPMVTCAAFALELYLKCLISMETGNAPPNRHELDELFKLLHPDTQKSIRDYFDQNGGDTIAFVKAQFVKAQKSQPTINFDYILRTSRRAFPIVRYIYEGLPAEQGWLGEVVMEGARAIILKRFPHWKDARQSGPAIVRSVPFQ